MMFPKPTHIKKKKVKTITVSKAKKNAWKVFSLYIRTKYADKMGFVCCYTCDKQLIISHIQAGHGIPGRNNAVLFMEEVVRPQCVGCNMYGRGKYPVFTERLIEELGMETYVRLLKESQRTKQFKAQDYLEKEEEYKCKLEMLQTGTCSHGVNKIT